MTRSRWIFTLAAAAAVAVVAIVAGGLTLWAQPRNALGGSFIVSGQFSVNGALKTVELLATFTSDGKVMSSDETLFAFDPDAGVTCGFVDPASGVIGAQTSDGVARFGTAHGSWKFTHKGVLWNTFALGNVKGRTILRRARGIGTEVFKNHGGPVVIDFFDASDMASPLCSFRGHWAATRIEPIGADFGDQ